MMRTAWAALALILAGPVQAEERIEVDTAIVFLADISRSMDAYEIALTREAHAVAIASPEVLSAIEESATGRIAVAYIEFAGRAYPRIGWHLIDGPQAALVFAAEVLAIETGPENGTVIGSGLEYAAAMIDTMPYDPLRIVVDVMGDGIETSALMRTDLMASRDALVARGVVINALALMVLPSSKDLAADMAGHVVGGPGAFLEPVYRHEDLVPAVRRKVARELY